MFPCYAILLYRFRGQHYAVSREISELNARNQRMLASSLGSIDLVKSSAAEERVGGAIRTGFARETLFRLRAVRLANTFLFLTGLIPLVCQGVLVSVGIHLILKGQWSLGSLWALNCYLMNVFHPVSQLCSAFPLTQSALASAARLIELQNATREPRLDSGIEDFELKGSIELKKLFFAYHPGHTVLAGIDLVKTSAAEERVGGAIRTGFARETLFRLRAVKLANTFLFLTNLIPLVCQGVLAAVGIHLILKGQWSLGSLWALNCYLMNVFRPVSQLCGAFPLAQSALASAARLIELQDATREPRLDSGIEDFELKGAIELHDLTFAYHPGRTVLDGIDLTLEPGAKLLVSGPSGSGKSTLFALLLGFYKPVSGSILLDGRPLDDYNVRALRRQIGYLGPFPEFIPSALRVNLTLGCRETPSDDAIIDALAAAGADSVVRALPHRLDTVLTESGRNFSAGERLRFALARELLRGTRVLLLDEATAHLDADNETRFLETVLRVFRDRTILMIRHTPHPLTASFPVLQISETRHFSTRHGTATDDRPA